MGVSSFVKYCKITSALPVLCLLHALTPVQNANYAAVCCGAISGYATLHDQVAEEETQNHDGTVDGTVLVLWLEVLGST